MPKEIGIAERNIEGIPRQNSQQNKQMKADEK
jgi:hypothetical protein